MAEILVSPDYRHTVNAAFELEPEIYRGQQIAAEELLADGLNAKGSLGERVWEIRRKAAVVELQGTDLGLFGDFIQDQGGKAPASESSSASLGAGHPAVVRTNTQILGMSRIHEEPIDFLDAAIGVIDDSKKQGKDTVGPENFATALKLFADKFASFPSTHLDPIPVKRLVDATLDGLTEVAKTDKPNFIEMTNVYAAIRTLPAGTVDPRFTRPLITYSLEELSTFGDSTLALARTAIGKIEIEEFEGEAAATLVDLSMRKGKPFQTTRDLEHSLRALANVPTTPAANRAFKTLLGERNNLEEPLTIGGAETVTEHLVRIVEDVIDDPDLTLEAKELARTCTLNALKIYTDQRRSGDLTNIQLENLGLAVKRIADNYNKI